MRVIGRRETGEGADRARYERIIADRRWRVRETLMFHIRENGGAPERVPEREYERVLTLLNASALRNLDAIAAGSTILKDFMHSEGLRLARRYPKPKPYAKKKARR